MNKLPGLSVFFPAYNEEANIAASIEKALDIIPTYADKFEILIIDDGSQDKTKEIAESFSLDSDEVKVISHGHNRGYGAALKSGFDGSRFEYVFFTDCDLQFELKEIDKFVDLIDDCDIAAGYRIKRNDPIHRVINGKAYNMLVKVLFGLKVRDIDCAFKLIRKKVLDSVELKSESQFISAELLIRSTKKGFRIKQVGANHFSREGGSPTGNSIRAIVNSFKELFVLWKELR